MAVAGALAGIAGANQIMGLPPYQGSSGFSGQIGFDAIALALLGRSHPVGVVWAGLLFGALAAGGRQLQGVERIPIDLVVVIQALIIVFIAAPALVRAIYRIKGEDEGAERQGEADGFFRSRRKRHEESEGPDEKKMARLVAGGDFFNEVCEFEAGIGEEDDGEDRGAEGGGNGGPMAPASI